MSSVNKVMLVGRLGADVELRYTSGGRAVATISVATSDTWKDANGQRQERTEWTRCTIWGDAAENAAKYIGKGSQVYVEGRLQTDKYVDKEGVTRYSTKVSVAKLVYLGSKSDRVTPPSGSPPDTRFEHAKVLPFAPVDAPGSDDGPFMPTTDWDAPF